MTTSSGHHRFVLVRSIPRFAACMVVFSLVLLMPGIVRAQGTGQVDDSTYVTATGQTITWAAPWAVAPDGIRTTDQYDMVVLTDGSASVIVGTGTFAVETARDFLLFPLGADPEAATAIDAGTSGDLAYWFDLMPVDDVPFGVFTLATQGPPVTMTVYLSPIPSFAAGMSSAQAAIAIDGSPVFPGIGGDGLQAQLATAASPTATAVPSTTPAAGSTADRTVTVASATVTYGSSWEYEEEGSTPGEVAMFINVASPSGQTTLVVFGMMPPSGSDPSMWLRVLDDGFCTELGIDDAGPLEVQSLASGNAWSLRKIDFGTPPLAMLGYADVTSAHDETRITFLITDAPDIQTVLADTQATIRIDDTPAFADLDPATVQARLEGTPAPTPAPTLTPTPAPTPSPPSSTADRRNVPIPARSTPLPPAAATPAPAGDAGQPVIVGNTVVSWTGAWQYDAASSMSEQATLAQVDPGAGTLKLATYGEFTDQTVSGPDAALEAFTSAFFDSAGATAVTQIGAGQLDNGTVWKSYTLDLQGLQLTFLITVSQAPGGEYIVSTLTGNTDQFAGTIQQAQAEILLDGQPVFLKGIDPQVVLGSGV